MIILYIIALLVLAFFSFGFVDANFPLKLLPGIFEIVRENRASATVVYTVLITFFFTFYLWIIKQTTKKTIDSRSTWKLVLTTCVILFLSYPAFSYDIFNYIATAKVTFLYRENPYLVMPIEISHEPMLAFLHAANKVALYGPIWISLTAIPFVLGFGNLLLTLLSFKTFVLLFYLGLSWFIWHLTGKNPRALAFFALNPLVITEALVSGHNDIIMMFFALAAFYLVKKKHFWFGLIVLLLSVFIKGATAVLVPLFGYLWWREHKKKKVEWQQVWFWAATLLFVVFFLSPLREELYPWYFIWPLSFVAMMPSASIMQFISFGFMFGLPLRFAPFIYFGDWGGVVPFVKKLVSVVPPLLGAAIYAIKKKN